MKDATEEDWHHLCRCKWLLEKSQHRIPFIALQNNSNTMTNNLPIWYCKKRQKGTSYTGRRLHTGKQTKCTLQQSKHAVTTTETTSRNICRFPLHRRDGLSTHPKLSTNTQKGPLTVLSTQNRLSIFGFAIYDGELSGNLLSAFRSLLVNPFLAG